MNYPVWDVPVIGSGLVIGIIAVIHVLISHFAVGGGLFLALTETKALREGRRDWREKLKKHSKFFLVLTGVYGAMTGVGIWFSIGLVNPEGTSALIHNFVFGWAIEWVVFLVELSLAAVYYYTWDRVPDKTHERIGWLYAISSFLTLVIINGILSFKLTPSAAWLASAGTGNEPALFFQAFFNATYFPSLMLRTLACVSLAGIWSLVFFSRLDSDVEGSLKDELIRWSAKWLVPAYLLMPIFFAWYVWEVPADHRALMGLGISTIGTGAFTQVTRMALITLMTSATIGGVVYFLAWRSPRDFSFGHAVSILFLALMATASTESVREMLRKPYVVKDYLYSNSVRLADVERRNTEGYLKESPWNPDRADHLTIQTGKRMFQGQCLSCHTLDGYRSLRRLMKGRDGKAIGNVLQMLHDNKPDSPYRKFMPPLVGTPGEIEALRVYLDRAVNGDTTKVSSK
ncbi:MAG: cytochrome ubiquinol oxidase subunit I [Fibrobacterota bacterium]